LIVEAVGGAAVSALTTHILKWIANLRRAGDERKNESRACLVKVVLAVRKTSIYCHALDEGQQENYAKEEEISLEWTKLALELDGLKLHKLAKKCRVKGWYWENQGRFDQVFLEKSQITFTQVESLANQLIHEIDNA